MGRPVRDDVLGSDIFGPSGVRVLAWVPGGSGGVEGYIEEQISTRRFLVTTPQGTGICKLRRGPVGHNGSVLTPTSNTAFIASGEVLIPFYWGSPIGTSPIYYDLYSPVKFNKRLAYFTTNAPTKGDRSTWKFNAVSPSPGNVPNRCLAMVVKQPKFFMILVHGF